MSNMMEYKGYHAKIEFDQEDMLLVGEVFGIQDTLCFHGRDVNEVVEMFHQSIDEYLDMCKEIGKEPDKEYKGSFNVRIAPELHKKVALSAAKQEITLNKFVENALRNAVEPQGENTTVFVLAPEYAYNSMHKTIAENESMNKVSAQKAYPVYLETKTRSDVSC